jgi:hypothetical protein
MELAGLLAHGQDARATSAGRLDSDTGRRCVLTVARSLRLELLVFLYRTASWFLPPLDGRSAEGMGAMPQNSEATLRLGTSRASLLSSPYSGHLDSISPLWYLLTRETTMCENIIYCSDDPDNARSCVKNRFRNPDET